MAVLQRNAVVIDAHLREVGSPPSPDEAPSGTAKAGWSKGRLTGPALGCLAPGPGQYRHRLCLSMSEGDVSDVEILGEGDQTEPASYRRALPLPRHQRLEIGSPVISAPRPASVGPCH